MDRQPPSVEWQAEFDELWRGLDRRQRRRMNYFGRLLLEQTMAPGPNVDAEIKRIVQAIAEGRDVDVPSLQ